MSRSKRKNRDYLPFMALELNHGYECGDHPLLTDEELFKMSIAKRLGKIVIPRHYDVAFTYTMRKPFADSKEEVEKFNKVSDKFEKAVVDLLSEMMDFCSDIDMEVKGI